MQVFESKKKKQTATTKVLNAKPESTWIEFLIDTAKKANQINDMKRVSKS